jgi:hypothetical protein
VNSLRRISALGLAVMIPLVVSGTTLGTWDPRTQRDDGGWSAGFYMAQAEAMVQGRLDVPRKAIQGECFDYRELCYGYFGITASLVRLPFLPILRWLGSALTPVFLGVAVLLAYWTAIRLIEDALAAASAGTPSWVAVGYHAAAVLAFGPGGTLIFVTRPAVFEEAVAWATAFFLLALTRLWAWVRTHAIRDLVWAVLLGILAANARLTTALGCVVLGMMVMMFAWRTRARAALVLGLALAVLPAATTAGVFILKFDTPAPDWRLNEQIPEAGHWRDILQRNGDRINSVIFVPTALVAYFRPDAVAMPPGGFHFDFRFPYRAPIWWVRPLPERGAYVERVASLTSTMPWPWAITLSTIVVLPLARRRIPADEWLMFCGFLLSGMAMVVPTITHFGIANRYLADFFPLSVVGTLIGARWLPPGLVRGRRAMALVVAAMAVAAVTWSVLVTWWLSLRLFIRY